MGNLLGRRVGPESPPRAVLLGFPSDEGVRRNDGRPGAAEGPREIRRRLYGFTPHPGIAAMAELLERTADLGDVEVTGDLEEDQERLAAAVEPHLREGAFAVVLGGGHETAYGHFLGYVAAGLEPEILNLDAHPDVRPLRDGRGHSGSPFRQALEHPSGACRRYRVAGLLPHAVAAEHLRFLEERGGEWRWGRDLDPEAVDRLLDSLEDPAAVSLDLDALDQSVAPGVSAPAAGGLGLDVWLRAARAAGESPAVRSVEVVELNPAYDPDGRTARVAALTAWRVLAGLARREPVA